jgi:hypothetical protein
MTASGRSRDQAAKSMEYDLSLGWDQSSFDTVGDYLNDFPYCLDTNANLSTLEALAYPHHLSA